jgi:hypothetical protein
MWATGVSVGHAKWQDGRASYQGQARGMDVPVLNASSTTPTGRGDRPSKVLTAFRRLCSDLTSTRRRGCVLRCVGGCPGQFHTDADGEKRRVPTLGKLSQLQVVSTHSCGPGRSPGTAWSSSTPTLPPLASAPTCYGAGDGEAVGAATARHRFRRSMGTRNMVCTAKVWLVERCGLDLHLVGGWCTDNSKMEMRVG